MMGLSAPARTAASAPIMKSYEVVVVGAGSGLNVLGPCVEAGHSVAIIEGDKFGGTCANRGCIPSKMFIYAADIAESVARGAEFGVHATVDRVDWPALQKQVWAAWTLALR
jgi:mycothione reductase